MLLSLIYQLTMGRKRKQVLKNKPSDSRKEPKNDQKVDLEFKFDERKYDDSNALVVLDERGRNKSQSSKKKKVHQKEKKPLSKKATKKLTQVIQRKQKKEDRNSILEELQKYQVSDAEFSAMTSTSISQTKGLKRSLNEMISPHVPSTSAPNDDFQNKTGAEIYKTGKKFKLNDTSGDQKIKYNPNIVRYEEKTGSDDSDDDSSEDEQEISQLIDPPVVESEEKACEGQNDVPEITKEKLKEEREEVSGPTVYVEVNRRPEIEEVRQKLPVITEEQVIMEHIRYKDVVVVCGETGSGKTTQVPQFLYEAGYAASDGKMICVTEPRRVAAISMSKRVADEMNLSSDIVSYHIRYENNITKDTKIKFVTDGVLLREIQKDFLISSYSVVIIDEAHERSVFSDILIGLLSRIIPLRLKRGNPLKLVIMSATLRINDFTQNRKLFKEIPPVVKIDARQYPVTTHFLKTTPSDYMDAAYRKVIEIHMTQPAGGILVFVTGRYEVNILCRKLSKAFPSSHQNDTQTRGKKTYHKKQSQKSSQKLSPEKKGEMLPKVDEDKVNDDEAPENENVSGSDEETSDDDDDDEDPGDKTMKEKYREPLYCLPLYSMLPKEKQSAVFMGVPVGHRLCVISTNVAETSLTIPDVKYVVDTGKVKTKVYDKTTGVSAYIISWCSKASSEQRKGRAGRTSPGHCYRLFSSAVFNNDFPDFCDPEIVTKPIDDLVLQMKSFNIIKVVNFPFPTPPDVESLVSSERRLIEMGALTEIKTSVNVDGRKSCIISPLGRVMSKFPVSPRYSKMMSYAYPEILPFVIAIISGLTVQEIFVDNNFSADGDKSQSDSEKDRVKHQKWVDQKKKWSGTGNEHLLGDLMVVLKAIGSSEYTCASAAFHNKCGIRHKAMAEVHKLRKQLSKEVQHVLGEETSALLRQPLKPPTDHESKHLRQIALCGFYDQIARRVEDTDPKGKKKISYQSIQVDKPVFLEANCALFDDKPEYLVYQEIHEKNDRMYMRNVVAIDPEWIPVYSKNLCNLSKPLDTPEPFYDETKDCIMCYVNGTFGPYGWSLPEKNVIEYPSDNSSLELDKFKWFARYLLNGDVHPFFRKFRKDLLTSSSIITKSWARLQPKTISLTERLAGARVDTLKSLVKKWSTDPKFLMKEYLEWIPESTHLTVIKEWPVTVSTDETLL